MIKVKFNLCTLRRERGERSSKNKLLLLFEHSIHDQSNSLVLHVLREKVTYRKTLACTANRQIVSSHTFFRAGISFRSFVAVDTHVLLKVTNLNQSIFHRMSLIFVHPKHTRYSHKNRIEIVCEPFEWTLLPLIWDLPSPLSMAYNASANYFRIVGLCERRILFVCVRVCLMPVSVSKRQFQSQSSSANSIRVHIACGQPNFKPQKR